MGHLASTVEFAKRLIDGDEHLSITVLVIRAPFDFKVDDFAHSLSSSLSFPKRLRFIILPHHPNTTNSHSLHRAAFIHSVIEYHKPHVRDAVSKLNSDPDSPPIAGLVVDMFCTTMFDVATEFGIPPLVFYTSGAAFLGFVLHIHTLRERDNVDTSPYDFMDSGLDFAVPCFKNHVPASVFPLVMTEGWAPYFFSNVGRMKKAKGIIVNTFDELESHAVQSFCNSDLPVYTIEPILSVLGEHKATPEGSNVLKWLDDQAPSSVLFLCFGSKGYLEDEKQVREIARALETSGVHFIWSLRKPPPKGEAATVVETPKEYTKAELEGVVGGGFLERTAEMGRVIGWAPQAQILAHKAVGGFVSHCGCGWNSILESVYCGVPIAAWPLHSEQQVNAFQLVRELKMSVEISLDYRIGYGLSKTRVIGAERIERGIRGVMEKESEVRKKVKEMSEMSRKTLKEGGSSYAHLGRLIQDIRTELAVKLSCYPPHI